MIEFFLIYLLLFFNLNQSLNFNDLSVFNSATLNSSVRNSSIEDLKLNSNQITFTQSDVLLQQNSFNYSNKPLIIYNDLNYYSYKQTSKQITKYIIIASSVLIPGSVFRLIVNLLESIEPINIVVTISQKEGLEIAGAEELGISQQSSELILIKVFTNNFN